MDLGPWCRVHQGPLLLEPYLSIPSGVISLRARNCLPEDKCEIVLSTECTSILSRIITAIEKNEKERISKSGKQIEAGTGSGSEVAKGLFRQEKSP